MIVGDIMHRGVMTVESGSPLQEVTSFFVKHGITGAPVVDEAGRPLGVISMSDLMAHAAGLDKPKEAGYLRDLWDEDRHHHHGLQGLTFEAGVTAGEVMTDFLVRVDQSSPVRELLELMKTARLHRVFVTDQDLLVGIVTTLDLVMLLDRLLEEREGPSLGRSAGKGLAPGVR